jgi:hypothetical protein
MHVIPLTQAPDADGRKASVRVVPLQVGILANKRQKALPQRRAARDVRDACASPLLCIWKGWSFSELAWVRTCDFMPSILWQWPCCSPWVRGGLPTLHDILWLIPCAQGTARTQIHINTNREKDPHIDRHIQWRTQYHRRKRLSQKQKYILHLLSSRHLSHCWIVHAIYLFSSRSRCTRARPVLKADVPTANIPT